MTTVWHADGERVDVDNPHVLLTNKHGDYFALGMPNSSNYHGFFAKDDDGYVKILSNISPDSGIGIVKLNGTSVERQSQDDWQHMALHEKGLLMECSGSFSVTLDCKRMHDETVHGRSYHLEREPGLVRIAYAARDYMIYVCIATDMDVRMIEKWRPVEYPYDERRATPSNAWVYDAIQVSGKGRLALAVGDNPADCEEKARDILDADFPAAEENVARNAVRTLCTETGILAGLPWFHQEWSRDELISLGGLFTLGEHEFAQRILDKWFSSIGQDGVMPAIYPAGGLESSDAPGWLGLRTVQLLEMQKLPEEIAVRWKDAIARLIEAQKRRMRGGLVWTGSKETWMDTQHHDDGRAGACIEIQALFIALCNAYRVLSGTSAYDDDAVLVGKAVRERLVQEGRLLDRLYAEGSPDFVGRPNCFMACYIAPEIFSNAEWRTFFENALDRLWLGWGGLSSISADDDLFQARDSGEDVAAYHRGDSWYFMNNMVATVLHRIDRERFSHYIEQILDASRRDLLEQGFAGHCSEISSAGYQEAMGCHAQAWSAATLLELLSETHNMQ